ncbi:ABC transporter permease [Bacillus sp. FJAT-27251]|uniref:ABC transporter permease n=1 Tax=Bacillus sp. FJAT-27251 TaxID=1684142 RepID=UPI0006A7E776|nr:ABC transporter permease [Bacillus sp. FJAT-27251]
MGYWWLAAKDALLMVRDKKALLTLVFMPVLLIGILGAAFGNMFSEGDADVPVFTLGIVNQDEGLMGGYLEKAVFTEMMGKEITVKNFSHEEVLVELEEKRAAAGLILPAAFSESLMAGKAVSLEIISAPGNEFPAMIVENVVQQFSRQSAVQAEGMKFAAEESAKRGEPFQPENFLNMEESNVFPVIEEVGVESDRSQVGSFQYYAAGMGVMFLLMTVVTGVGSMIEEKEQEVYRRLLVTRLTYSQYLLGKLLGLLLLSVLQLGVIILGTSVLFGVHWGNSLAGVILIGFAFVFSACGLGILFGSLANTEKAFSAGGMLGTQILAAAGGSMVPLYMFPDWVNSVMRVFPNALALQSFLDLMSGEGLRDVAGEAAALFLIGCLFLLAAWLRLAAGRRKSYA